MTLADKPDFARGLTDLAAAFNADVRPARAEAYWRVCEPFPLAQVQRACDRALREHARMPAPAQIRALLEAQPVEVLRSPIVEASLAGREYACEECQDTGWTPCTVDASTVYGDGSTVPAVRRCGCRSHNPVIAWKRADAMSRRIKGKVYGED